MLHCVLEWHHTESHHTESHHMSIQRCCHIPKYLIRHNPYQQANKTNRIVLCQVIIKLRRIIVVTEMLMILTIANDPAGRLSIMCLFQVFTAALRPTQTTQSHNYLYLICRCRCLFYTRYEQLLLPVEVIMMQQTLALERSHDLEWRQHPTP